MSCFFSDLTPIVDYVSSVTTVSRVIWTVHRDTLHLCFKPPREHLLVGFTSSGIDSSQKTRKLSLCRQCFTSRQKPPKVCGSLRPWPRGAEFYVASIWSRLSSLTTMTCRYADQV